MINQIKYILVCLLFLSTGIQSVSGDPAQSAVDLTQLSIEELMQIEVTSVSKRDERLFESAAAVFILTQEDLRRSGTRTIQDALRMVPGMYIGQIDANKWAISARGFNQTFSNKLLVMVDGRSVYSRIYSGVLWETQDINIEDIDRIEVIRGPGATLWGANAVNGIINVITKHSDQTIGGAIHSGVGTQEIGPIGIRYGNTIHENWTYRIYSQYFKRQSSVLESGTTADDGWWFLKNGFRSDYRISEHDNMMSSGEIYTGIVGQTLRPEFIDPADKDQYAHDLKVEGGHFLTRWNHRVSHASDFTLHLYYSSVLRDDPQMIGGRFQELDFDFDYRWKFNDRHRLVWGLRIRSTWDCFNNTALVHFDPTSRRYNLYGIFLQDDVALLNRRLFLTVGSKFERDDLAGPELQPNVRLRWLPTSGLTLWGAVSRAVRTPARTDQDFSFTRYLFSMGQDVYYLRMQGSRDLISESLLSNELGLRANPLPCLYFDCTGFYHTYKHLRTYALGESCSVSSDSTNIVYAPYIAGDDMSGQSYGFESLLEYRFQKIRIRTTYSYMKLILTPDEGIENMRAEDAEGEVPRHQWSIQAFVDFPCHLELDGMLRFVDELPVSQIDSYLTADIRLGWNPSNRAMISIMGQNLIRNNYIEFKEQYTPFYSTLVVRKILGRVSFYF